MIDEEKTAIDTKVAVIIPVYNAVNFLQTAVESVLKQDFFYQMKIILVDDGSTDGSADLCNAYASNDNRVLVIHQENGGVSSARNSGIDFVLSMVQEFHENSYIAFLDADDAWNENFFDTSTNDLLKKGYDLIGYQSCCCNENMTRKKKTISLIEGDYCGGTSSVWIHATQHFGAMFYRVGLIKRYNIKFYPIKASEDKIFVMQSLYLAKNVHLKNSLMYMYRQIHTSIVHKRETGIEYFQPIINAYLKSDEQMLCWANSNRGELCEGTILAKHYVMDLVDDCYQNGGGKKDIDCFFDKNPQYKNLIINTGEIPERWKKMNKHPLLYLTQKRIYGLLFKMVRRIYYINFVKIIIDKKRYPYNI